MLALFTLSIFLGAGLLFLVQPMVGRMLLPLLGGSPGVWNTCMVFFQAVLLAGYLYAHLLTKLKSTTAQLVVHAAVLMLAAALLPIGVAAGAEPPAGEMPIWWLLGTLATTVGAPFFALASAGPLFQKWLAQTDHPHAKDPYFLYAASNLGSMLALIGYPLLVEPSLGLASQRLGWSIAYGAFGLCAVGCGLMMVRRARARDESVPARAADPHSPAQSPDGQSAEVARALETRVTGWMRLRWVFLAFVPSSLMLGCTQYIATDIASFPLLWVIPLSIYLLSFIIAFSPLGRGVISAADFLLPLAALVLVLVLYHEFRFELLLIVTPHLAGLLIVALACHGRLAAERPDAARLTEFYLLIAVGGVLGGLFNSLVAPMVFNSIAEYPIAVVLACLARPWRLARSGRAAIQEWWVRFNGALDIAVPIAIAAIFVSMPAAIYALWRWANWEIPGDFEKDWRYLTLRLGLPAALCLVFAQQRIRFALCVAAIALVPFLIPGKDKAVVHAERTFFGVYRVLQEPEGRDGGAWRHLHHGRTLHGSQFSRPPRALDPVTYYTHDGPVGDLFNLLAPRKEMRVACIGMGTGTLAAYCLDGWRFDFFEIDPAVIRIATDDDKFTYLKDGNRRGRVTWDNIGDARLTLARQAPGQFDVMIFDAFSSDAIPVHLLTREAIEMYLSRLKPGGLLVIHITNGYVNLRPVVAAAAKEFNLTARMRQYFPTSHDRRNYNASASEWVIMARDPADLGMLLNHADWKEPQNDVGIKPWTDDYSNLWDLLRWR